MKYENMSVSLTPKMNDEYKKISLSFFKPLNDMKELFEVANHTQVKSRQHNKSSLGSDERMKGNIAVQGDLNV